MRTVWLLLLVTLSGCIGGGEEEEVLLELPSMQVPPLRIGASATYAHTGAAPSNTLAQIGAGVLYGGTQLFPGNGTISVQVRTAEIILPTGDFGPATTIDYNFSNEEIPDTWLATEYQDGGRIAVQLPKFQTVNNVPTNKVQTTWLSGVPDLFLASLFGNRTIVQGGLQTAWFPAQNITHNNLVGVPLNWTANVEELAILELDLNTTDGASKATSFTVTFDAGCAFPTTIELTGVGAWSALRQSCELGDGRPVEITGPSAQSAKPSPHWVRQDLGKMPASAEDGPDFAGFSLAAAWGALESDSAYQNACGTACSVLYIHWAETNRQVGCIVLNVGCSTAHYLQWGFTVWNDGRHDFVVEKTGNTISVVATGPLAPDALLPDPLQSLLWGLALDSLQEAILNSTDSPLQVEWFATNRATPPERHEGNGAGQTMVAFAPGLADLRAGGQLPSNLIPASFREGRAGKLGDAGAFFQIEQSPATNG